MTPSLPVPTDNIYKFACLFGLVLFVSAFFGFIASYTSALDSKIKYAGIVIPLAQKANRTETDEQMLAMHKKLLDLTKTNERTSYVVVTVVATIGLLLSVWGAERWYGQIQARDDKLAELQIEKLEAEIAKLRDEHQALLSRNAPPPEARGDGRNGV